MNSESPNTSFPTVARLREARLKRWHHTGEALLTVENLRSWINTAGLVLFAPRPQIVAPAPTFVEAVLGESNPEPTLEQLTLARGLLARLVADGIAVPLNLMGAHGIPADTPDFVASAAVFSYVFTLRGDKAWKQPPATSGAIKVSNLALAAHDAISSNGAVSAYDLATQLGKEITEAACLRALNELWTHLRIVPLIQDDARPTVWELTSARFSKQIKAGSNAGIPSAVSALVSLYLGQTTAASEDEIESFLSPLAPRSRIRDVTHTLLNARQLDTIVIEGKTLLHVAGEAPSFGAPVAKAADVEVPISEAAAEDQATEGAPRITKYIPSPRKIGTGYLAKGKPAAGKRPFDRRRGEGFKPRPGARDERERRPFRKTSAEAPQRRFDKPWEEERPRRTADGTTEFRPPRRPRPENKRQDSERGEFRSGPRPPRRDEGRPERRPRPQSRDADRRGAYPDRGPDRGQRGATFQKRDERPRQDRSESDHKERSTPSRPAFRRFDAPKRDRQQRAQPDRNEGRERSGGFEQRPPRKQSGFQGRPPRRENRSEGGPPRREAGPGNRTPRREGGFGPRPGGKQGGNRPFGKSKFGGASGRPSGKFAKSPGKKKPFQKKPSDRTFKPRRDESA
ncbi:MAG TPA: hypothetical protein VLJ39_12015 [Tepidisphaeraceae bacterium]|nr:hypothetical protein [Tepidisphaeraceae bacterium]